MGKIVPIYPATGGLQQRSIRDAVTQAVLKLGEKLPESLPEEIRQKYDLIDIERAIRSVHMPETLMIFILLEEDWSLRSFLKLQLGVATVKAHKHKQSAVVIEICEMYCGFCGFAAF